MESLIEVRRAGFELAMREKLLDEGYCLLTVPEVMARGSDGRYSSVRIRGAWEGCNVALDSVVVELPQEWPPVSERDEGANEMRDACEHAIHAAGVKTK